MKGVHEFEKFYKRKELFPQRNELPDYYKPKYDVVHPRKICSVRDMSKKSWKEIKHRVEGENLDYYNKHMI